MDFLKGLENLKAFDIEKVAQTALNAVDEYPTKQAAVETGRVVVTTAAAGKAKYALQAWEELDFEGQKTEWEDLCSTMRELQQKEGGWEQRAKDAEYQLVKLANTLLGLPDPAPFLASTAALSAKIVEVEAANRELTAAAEAAAADSREVGGLVEAHRTLQAEHRELQEALAKRDAELAEAKAAAGEAAAARAQAEEAAAEAARLAAALKGAREEAERAQGALFEAVSKAEQEQGSRHREAELSAEELERALAAAAEAGLERDALAQRLAAATAQVSSLQATLAAARARGGAGGASGWEDDGGWEGIGPGGADLLEGAVGSGGGAAGASTGGSGLRDADAFWERQLTLKDQALAAAQAAVAEAKRNAAEVAARHEAAAQAAANAVAAAELAAARAEAELARRPEPKEYQELRARAEALQSLVDVQMEAEGWGRDAIAGVLSTPGGLTPPAVHSVLQERNRKLSAELASLKRALSEAQAAAEAAKAEAQEAGARAEQQAALARRLEEDLAAVQHTGSTPALRSAGASTTALGALVDPSLASSGAAASGLPSALPAALASAPSGTSLAGPAAAGAGGGEGGEPGASAAAGGAGGQQLLDIVVSQRDRFRQRMAQLEEEKGKMAEELGRTKRALEEARSDNVALYEKVRYLERYSSAKAASTGAGRTQVIKVDGAGIPLESASEDARGARYQCGPLAFEIGGGRGGGGPGGPDAPGGPGSGAHASVAGVRARQGRRLCFPADEPDEEQGTGPEARYSKAYEAKVNPFAEFQRSEVEQRVRQLQLHDRAVLAGSKLLVGSRMARVFVAVYAGLLHLFIMVLLYYAMSPRTVYQMVDMDAVTQQQQAAASSTAGEAAAGTGAAAAAAAAAGAKAAGRALLAAAGRVVGAVGAAVVGGGPGAAGGQAP